MALLARFACGCVLRVEIPAPPRVRCAEHGSLAELIQMPNGQVRYVALATRDDVLQLEQHVSKRASAS